MVLADPFDGHYLRFHTACSVIANNFVTTSADAAKVLEEQRLLRLAARDVPLQAPAVDYVYVRSDTIFFVDTQGMLVFAPGDYPEHPDYPLVRELLSADAGALPPGYRMLYELRPRADVRPYARLFEIERAPAQPAR